MTRTDTLRCTIVDDSPEVRYLISRAMETDGRFVMIAEAGSAKDGLEQATILGPDVVLVDWFLARENGAALLSTLRIELPDARLVAVTGSTDEAVHQEARDAGAHAVFVKRDLTTTLLDQIHGAAL